MPNALALSPNRFDIGNKSTNLSPSVGISPGAYYGELQNRGLAPFAGAKYPQIFGIYGERDLLMKDVFRAQRSGLDKRIAFGIPRIVDGIIARNPNFRDLDRVDLDETLKLYIGKMPYEKMILISKNELEMEIENIMIREQFLSPGFHVEMPPRKSYTINATIQSITRGVPSPPDFEG